ncbi:GNAT family N-acetyltransferase [Amaricoccus solimangrovi]|uniref:GNAT family N-acetyltransferase n=1 Tax=Amaricoccus solimangrovi TaxID=2589815 RepID=A0A501WBR4_9RHOB|nr:GNAT family N-acetyltransferase [Amaricoccus solimangrovi]TPE47373.1 GNAT family N-acetyltransferase [Amaricoccus solimangrovi]
MRIETERLILRPFEERDRADFAALVTDPAVTGAPAPVIPREDCQALFDFYLACWREEDLAYGAIERRGDGTFLGMAGLALFDAGPAAPRLCEIGWALCPRHRGAGYAVEAARGWLDHGFRVLGLERIVALTWAGNPDSLRVIGRLGFAPDPGFVHPDGEAPADRLAFAMTAGRWTAVSAGRAAS